MYVLSTMNRRADLEIRRQYAIAFRGIFQRLLKKC